MEWNFHLNEWKKTFEFFVYILSLYKLTLSFLEFRELFVIVYNMCYQRLLDLSKKKEIATKKKSFFVQNSITESELDKVLQHTVIYF